jgi:cytochrome c553
MRRAMTKSIRMFVLAMSGAGLLTGALPRAATAISAAQRYTDLRQIEPIHGDAAAGAQKATPCHACHGANGVSVEPMFPRLAGQRADYLYHRLVSFKQADPKDPYYSKTPMTALVAHLSDDDMRDLASYFAAQIPQATDVAAAASASGRGEFLYRSGDASHGVPPCQGCHGAEAQGVNAPSEQYAAYPALRGQYGPYLIARLTSFRQGLPHDSSNDLLMSGVARTLDDDAIQAVAAWLSSLTPTKSL